MRHSIKTRLALHKALGRVLVFAGGTLAAVLYALLAILADPAITQATMPTTARLIAQCLWPLVEILGGLEVLVMAYLYQVMLSRYTSEFRLYRTIGMPRWYLACQLIGDNLVWAVLTVGFGIVFGILTSKFWVMWLVRMMALPLSTGILWSGRAAGLLLIGYTLGYAALAVSGWLRLGQPASGRDGGRRARPDPTRWWWIAAALSPLGLGVGDYGLGHWAASPLDDAAWFGLALIGLIGTCAATLPAALALLARASAVRRRAAWLLGVTTSREFLRHHWLTMSLAAGLLSGAFVLLIAGLIQYQALHTARPLVPFLSALIPVNGVGIDAVAGISLFTTTVIGLATIIATAIILGLAQRLNGLAISNTDTLSQLGMPQTLLSWIERLEARLVGALPLTLGVLNASLILGGKMTALLKEANAAWFIIAAFILYPLAIQTTRRTAHV
ncbi:FtsX-like permease family protein [Lacticaseibacillus kribbianus]|uniref:FtsX-like permease family protein n=1 Tax=Lacticaseibacillus kribbianus TaxID=2926292 RepID=UPI001CD3FB9C|nr:FtsX-like permease family protein [Lacticaseibacillus kribbianus]